MTDDTLVIAGQPVPAERVGWLADSTSLIQDGTALRERFGEHGYLFLRNVIDPQEVMAARQEVLRRLADVGEIRRPAGAGLPTGRSTRDDPVRDRGDFWRSVSEGAAVRKVTHGPDLHAVTQALFGCESCAFDFIWLRATAAGRASPLHFDHVYMNRGSQRVVTGWLPLGPVLLEDGPLIIIEGAHRDDDLIAPYRGHDVDRDPSFPGGFPEDALTLAAAQHRRILTARFEAGDVLLFGMFTLHGSADNVSPQRRVRLSCDVRYQPAADARDDRWFGKPPPGHDGLSYGGLSSAQPLTADPIVR